MRPEALDLAGSPKYFSGTQKLKFSKTWFFENEWNSFENRKIEFYFVLIFSKQTKIFEDFRPEQNLSDFMLDLYLFLWILDFLEFFSYRYIFFTRRRWNRRNPLWAPDSPSACWAYGLICGYRTRLFLYLYILSAGIPHQVWQNAFNYLCAQKRWI